MQITLKNQTANPLSYLSGAVTVAANSQTILSRSFNVIITQDAQFLSDVNAGILLLNNGAGDFSGPSAFDLIRILAQYISEPKATAIIYYSALVNILQTTTTAASSLVWSMRNKSDALKIATIERIQLAASFCGTTPVVPAMGSYEIIKFSTATPTGGTSVSVVQADTLGAATEVTDVRFLDTGLTDTSVVYDSSPFAIIDCPLVAGNSVRYVRENVCINLQAGEGIGIRLNRVAQANLGLSGEIVWSIR